MDLEPIENMYFNWLCAKVRRSKYPTSSASPYLTLLRTLHNTEFVWTLSGDDNRAADGVELRSYFLIEARHPDIPEWRQQPCSLLEMLIALANRAEFLSTGDVRATSWFWIFMQNLGLDECTDSMGFTPEDIGEVLYSLVWRQYNENGTGGLFPLPHTEWDQRTVEIWHQLCEYITANDI